MALRRSPQFQQQALEPLPWASSAARSVDANGDRRRHACRLLKVHRFRAQRLPNHDRAVCGLPLALPGWAQKTEGRRWRRTARDCRELRTTSFWRRQRHGRGRNSRDAAGTSSAMRRRQDAARFRRVMRRAGMDTDLRSMIVEVPAVRVEGCAEADDQHHDDRRECADRRKKQAKRAPPTHTELQFSPTVFVFRLSRKCAP